MWGVFPIFFKFIDSVGAIEILAHRIIWSAIILFILLKFRNKIINVKRLLKIKKVALTLFITGILIASNWGIFIYAVNQNQILATSLGYFINPLFSILLGAIILKRKTKYNVKNIYFNRIFCYMHSNLRTWKLAFYISYIAIVFCIIRTYSQESKHSDF
ncbi:EamA family transporter [Campylobacter fetus]|uniref:EamA family transporter n=1 Tax=Campylobacter fetus TaxID=196 RepID=UPI003AF641B3